MATIYPPFSVEDITDIGHYIYTDDGVNQMLYISTDGLGAPTDKVIGDLIMSATSQFDGKTVSSRTDYNIYEKVLSKVQIEQKLGMQLEIVDIRKFLALNGELATSVDGNRELVNSLSNSQYPLLAMTKLAESRIIDANGLGAPLDDGWATAEGEITGTKYYFSSSTGSDANDGLTPETAKKTFYRARIMLGNNLAPGDGILLKRGDVWSANSADENGMPTLWYQVLGTLGFPIVMTSYGIGNRPIIDGLQDKNAAVWTHTGLFNGIDVWETTPASPTVGIKNVIIDGVQALGCTDIVGELKLNTKWQWFHDYKDEVSDGYTEHTGSGKLYINVDPATISVEWSDSSSLLTYSTDSEYVHVKHLEVKHCRSSGITTSGNAKGCEFEYNTVGEGCAYGIVAAGTGIKIRYNIIDCKKPQYDYADGRSTYPFGGYEGIRNWGGGWDGGEIAYNTIRNFGHANLTINGGTTELKGYHSNVECHHNVLEADTIIYGGKFSVQYRVENLDFHHNLQTGGDNNQLNGIDGHYHHNWILNKRNTDMTQDALYNNGSGMSTNIQEGFERNIIEYNIFWDIDNSAVRLSSSNSGPNDSNIVRKNIMVDCGKLFAVYPGDHTGSCVFLKVEGALYAYKPSNCTIEENIMYQTNGETKVIIVGPEGSLTDPSIQFTVAEAEAVVHENGNVFINNINADPKFFNPEALDFRVADNSPAINIDTPNIGMYDLPKGEVNNISSTTGGATKFISANSNEIQVFQAANFTSEYSVCFSGNITSSGKYILNTQATSYAIIWCSNSKLFFYTNNTNYDTGFDLSDGVDRDFVFSYDGELLNVYVDKVKIYTSDLDGFTPNGFTVKDISPTFMEGALSDIYVINKVLTENERQLYSNNKAMFFNHAIGDIVSDDILFDSVDVKLNMPLNEVGSTKHDYGSGTDYTLDGYTVANDVQGLLTGIQQIELGVDGVLTVSNSPQIIQAVPIENYTIEVIAPDAKEYYYVKDGATYTIFVDSVPSSTIALVGNIEFNAVMALFGITEASSFEVLGGASILEEGALQDSNGNYILDVNGDYIYTTEGA